MSIQVQSGGSSSTLQSLNLTPQKNTITVKPSTGYDAISQVTLTGDNNFISDNIANGITIWGQTGTYKGPKYVKWGSFKSSFSSDYKQVTFTLPDGIEAYQLLSGFISGVGNIRTAGVYELQSSYSMASTITSHFRAYAMRTYSNDIYGNDAALGIRYCPNTSISSVIYYQGRANYSDVSSSYRTPFQVGFITNRSFIIAMDSSKTIEIKGIANSTTTNLSLSNLCFQSYFSFGFYYVSDVA